MAMDLDHSVCEELSSLVDSLTHSGNPSLDQDTVKKLKKICKQSDDYVKQAYHMTMTQLEKEHSEIRLSAFQVINELFTRSHCFRQMLVSDFQSFLELTAETHLEEPLPPPKEAAKMLKTQVLEAVQKWYMQFGEGYKKLVLGYEFLQTCKKVNFEEINNRNLAQQREQEQREARRESQRKERLVKITAELSDVTDEIESCLTELDACMTLLLPTPDDFQVPTEPEENTSQVNNISSDLSTVCQSGNNCKSNNSHNHNFLKHDDMPTDSENRNCDPSPDSEHEKPSGDVSQSKQSTCSSAPTQSLSPGTLKPDNTTIKLIKNKKNTQKEQCCTNESLCRNTDVKEESFDTNTDNEEIHSESGNKTGNIEDKNYDQNEDQEEDAESAASMLQRHGLSRHYNMQIVLTPGEVHLTQDADNKDLIQTMIDMHRLVTSKFLPIVTKCLKSLTKNGADQKDVKKAIDLKQKLERADEKCRKITIHGLSQKRRIKDNDADDSDSSDGFEDVPEKEGFEPDVPDHLKVEYNHAKKRAATSTATLTTHEWSIKRAATNMADLVKDPTSREAALNAWHQRLKNSQKERSTYTSEPSTSSAREEDSHRKELLDKAPKVPFGIDLYHWTEKDIEPPTLQRYDSLHRFWNSGANDEVVDKSAMEAINKRVINFTGEFVPVKWKCRAPLANGSLCERMDRQKCPFHGKIIARDITGKPADPSSLKTSQKKEESSQMDWEDPNLLREIEAATGKSLTLKKGKGKGRGKSSKKPTTNLTDLKKLAKKPRSRLEKKIFSRKAMSRVTEALNNLDEKRVQEKFGNTFHYSLK